MHKTSPYSNDPITLVLLEIRHPITPSLDGASLAALKSELADHTPIQRMEQTMEMDFPSGEQRISTIHKLVSRDLHTNVTFRNDAVILETTNYPGWEAFRSLAMRAMAARQDVAPVDGVERIGLRYIDEIRVPHHETELNWSDWVDPSLLSPDLKAGGMKLVPQQQQSSVVYRAQPNDDTIVLRYGASTGQAVVSTPNLTLPKEPTPGPFFLIDIDASWNPPGHNIPEFDLEAIGERFDMLHGPIKDTFESLITNRLRQEVLSNAD